MTSFEISFANHLSQSTAFAGAAALLAQMLRKNHARLRYWLWMAASLKFLAPFSALAWIGERIEWRSAPAIREAIVSAVAVVDFEAPLTGAARTAAPGHTAAFPMSSLLIALWILGCAVVLVRWLARWRQAASVVRAARPIRDGREVALLHRVQAAVGTRIAVAVSQSSVAPGVFGIVRPVLVLPASMPGRLTDAQLEAIFAHELCHVWRRDNLTAAIHMAVEAIFWFHPLVWWLGTRLMDERERACDEEVLRMGCDSLEYARGILRTCEFSLMAPMPCVAGVVGGDLKQRIQRITRRQLSKRLGPCAKLLLAGAALASIAAPMFIGVANAPVARAQSKGTAESFDAVSVKSAAAGARGRGFITDPGRVRMTNVSLGDMIMVAYGVQSFQISPKNLPDDRYEILATAPGHPSRILDARYETMMQALLADRFHLKMHREKKVLPVYALEAAKGGPKLKPSSEPGLSTRSTPGHVTATGATVLDLCTYLTRRIALPVVDLTGIKGLYDFQIDWIPGQGEGNVEPPDPNRPPVDPGSGPSLFTALQEQLGLKLTNKRLPVEMLVIDRWEKVTEN